MCTVSVTPSSVAGGIRLVCNRDERRTRENAWPPRLMQYDGVTALHPVDPESGGTWIAATDQGLLLAVLNLNRAASPTHRDGNVSRGRVIPTLVRAADLEDVRRRFEQLELQQFAPFRLLAANDSAAAVFVWDGARPGMQRVAQRAPYILSSSSLGDHLVEDVRAALFEDLLERCQDPWTAQDRLHQHSWPDRRHLSVLMSRPTARTVSRTTVVLAGTEITMNYAPVVDGWIGPVTTSVLKVSLPGAAAAA